MISFLFFIEKLPQLYVLILTFFLVFIFAVIDYTTGYQFAFSFFYLLPLIIFSYKFDLIYTFFMCIFCASLWQFINYYSGERFDTDLIAVWNVFMRFGFFFFTIYLHKKIQIALKTQTNFADIDPLTGIMNRRAFYKEIEQEMERCRRFSTPLTVVYMDLDKFKQHNDVYGHSSGDNIIQGFANILKKIARKTDSVARLGGDEFAMLLCGTSRDTVNPLIDRLKKEANVFFKTVDSNISVSFGLCSSKKAMDVDDFLKQADKAMYKAKRSGGNCHVSLEGNF
jgi:diguanylate cyclase (GGDEF)-like protein